MSDLEQISSGRPNLVNPQVDEKIFVPFQTHRLKNAGVLWVNWDLLRERGIEFPEEGLTPEFEQKILDTFAYAVPQKSEKLEKNYLPKTKEFYADRYGGSGLAYNLGSARAGAAGEFQIKGIGQTPLVRDENEFRKPEKLFGLFRLPDHSNGGASVREGVTEAIWGEVLHGEMPFGANRVVLVIATGTSTEVGMGINNPRALIVRENSLRPAHFMENGNASEEGEREERARVGSLHNAFVEHLPKKEGKLNGGEKVNSIQEGMEELMVRVARVFGAQYAKSIYHGSTSPSNIEISGKAIDHGPLTAIDGFSRVEHSDSAPNGSTLPYFDLLSEIVEEMNEHLGPGEKAAFVQQNEIKKVVNLAYWNEVHRGFLWLVGVPPEWIEELAKTKEGKQLAATLVEIAKEGNDRIIDVKKGRVEKNTGTYDLPKILALLVKKPASDDPEFKLALPDPRLRGQLLKRYGSLSSVLEALALKENIQPSLINEYQTQAIVIRNRRLPHLYRDFGLWLNIFKTVADYQVLGAKNSTQNLIDHSVAKGRRSFPHSKRLQLVLSESYFPVSGTVIRGVFDLKTGEYSTLVGARLYYERADLLGARVSWDQIATSILTLKGAPKGTSSGFQREGNFVYAEFPRTKIDKDTEFVWANGTHPLSSGRLQFPHSMGAVSNTSQAECGGILGRIKRSAESLLQAKTLFH